MLSIKTGCVGSPSCTILLNPQLDDNGKLLRGLIVRHLVLPAHRGDSIEALNLLEREIGHENMLLSLMSQYTPDFYVELNKEAAYKNLCRRLTSFEYDSVAAEAERLYKAWISRLKADTYIKIH